MTILKKLFQKAGSKGERKSREGKRFVQSLEFEVSGVDADGQDFAIRSNTTDISGEGGCLRLSRNVETGRTLTLKDKRGDSYKAQVCWHNFDLEYGKCLVGFKVVENSQDWLLNVVSLLGSLSNQHGTRTGLKT
jgi:hypothetical protein